VFNISDFVEDHPGSTETLLLQAGRDATVFFESMGHSLKVRVSIVLSCECLSICSLGDLTTSFDLHLPLFNSAFAIACTNASFYHISFNS